MRRTMMNVVGALAIAMLVGCSASVKEIPATESTQKSDVDMQKKMEEQRAKMMQNIGGRNPADVPQSDGKPAEGNK